MCRPGVSMKILKAQLAVAPSLPAHDHTALSSTSTVGSTSYTGYMPRRSRQRWCIIRWFSKHLWLRHERASEVPRSPNPTHAELTSRPCPLSNLCAQPSAPHASPQRAGTDATRYTQVVREFWHGSRAPILTAAHGLNLKEMSKRSLICCHRGHLDALLAGRELIQFLQFLLLGVHLRSQRIDPRLAAIAVPLHAYGPNVVLQLRSRRQR